MIQNLSIRKDRGDEAESVEQHGGANTDCDAFDSGDKWLLQFRQSVGNPPVRGGDGMTSAAYAPGLANCKPPEITKGKNP